MDTKERGRETDLQTRREAELARRNKSEFTGQKMAVDESKLDRDRFVYRWINDEPARLFAKTKQGTWDVVMNDGVKDDGTDLGNAVSIVVGAKKDGSPLRAYLCRKPRTFYEEDQKDKSRELDKQLEQLKRGNARDGASQSDYVPSPGIRMAWGLSQEP